MHKYYCNINIVAIKLQKEMRKIIIKFFLSLQIFEMKRIKQKLQPLVLPETLSVPEALNRVLRLPSVASKRYLTSKVTSSITFC